MQVHRSYSDATSRYEQAAVVAPCKQVMIRKSLHLLQPSYFRLKPFYLAALDCGGRRYTKRWFMNHCPVHVTRVMLSGIQPRELILHT